MLAQIIKKVKSFYGNLIKKISKNKNQNNCNIGKTKDIFITNIITEYDQKADSYGRGASIKSNKKEIKWSTFSDNDELNTRIKRTDGQKVGDQRDIIEYMRFCSGEQQENVEEMKTRKLIK